jgi:hypothetical protein
MSWKERDTLELRDAERSRYRSILEKLLSPLARFNQWRGKSAIFNVGDPANKRFTRVFDHKHPTIESAL